MSRQNKVSYVIGFDGGGTGTSILIEERYSGKKTIYQVGPTNRHSVGDAQVKAHLTTIFENLHTQNIAMEQVDCICFGGAGIDTSEDEQTIYEMFRSLGYEGQLKVVNDSVTALAGANADFSGGVLISGTGSIALGVSKNDALIRVGGWGHLIDDTGSAYAIARDGIRGVLQGYDGRGPNTKIWDGVRSVLNITSQEDLINFVYDPNRKKHEIAALAPIVTDLARMDQVADRIIDKTVEDLADHIRTLSKRMGSDSFSVGMIGSVLEKSDYIRVLLEKRISNDLPNVNLHLPKFSPVEGAIILAKKMVEEKS